MYHRVGAQAYKANLDNTIALCNLLDNPQHSFKSVHIAGTNGKGSVSHMLASVLAESGLKIGLYTSPHLVDFRERIRVNGRMIPRSFVTAFTRRYREAFVGLGLSFFEMTVGMAFDYFRKEAVDIAVIEVGLGGRLDSTNIITPLVSVITNISYDHMQLLGPTLEAIAGEKAGIIKPGIPVVIGESQEDTDHVFTGKAAACSAPISFADRQFAVKNVIRTGVRMNRLVVELSGRDQSRAFSIVSPLTGNYQVKNILTVTETCDQLIRSGIALTQDTLRRGIARVIRNTGFAGRWQVLSRNPLTICDTGHNVAGIRAVAEQIAATPHEHLHVVIGMVNDKDIEPILELLPVGATYYFCKPAIPRGLDATTLQEKANTKRLYGTVYGSVGDALEAAQFNAAANDLVFVGGSTFVVAEVV
jgi:dihydrofolate synthase/folylpolyglutamate synthase